MKSDLADGARTALLNDVRQMTPEQRLAAYVTHCQLMAKLQHAGLSAQPRLASPSSSNAD